MLNQIANALLPLIDTAKTKAESLSLIKSMQAGQQLPARVISMPSANLVKLMMLGTEITAQTNVQLKPGQQLQLQVVKQGPTPQLQIQNPLGNKAVPDQFIVLKDALPRQLLPKEVQQSLRTILNGPQTNTYQASTLRPASAQSTEIMAARQVAQVINAKAVPVQNLTAPAVKQALNQSGLMMEATLAKGVVPRNDNKADMLMLLAQWMPGLKSKLNLKQRVAEVTTQGANEGQMRLPAASLLERLTRLLEGSISRVQTHQAASLPAEEAGGRQVWQFELPLRLPEQLDHPLLQIERDGQNDNDEGGAGWSVNLAFDFDTLGPVQCRIRLEGEVVSVNFWSEREETTRLFQEKMPLLEAALHHSGLDTGRLMAAKGIAEKNFMSMELSHSLLDERA